MGSAVSDISNGINRGLGQAKKSFLESDLGRSDIGKGLAMNPALVGSSEAIKGILPDSPTAPGVPGPDASLEALKNYQIDQAKKFRGNLDQTKQSNAQSLKQDASQMEQAQQEQLGDSLNQRGLLFGGLAAGKRAGVRSASQSNLAGAISKSNQGLDAAANEMDQQAIATATGIQRQAQQIQNDIYSQAQARLNSQNSMIGNIASTAAMAAFL